jgi:hypothetical protein
MPLRAGCVVEDFSVAVGCVVVEIDLCHVAQDFEVFVVVIYRFCRQKRRLPLLLHGVLGAMTPRRRI